MATRSEKQHRPTRRRFLRSMLAAGTAPLFVPAHVLTGATAPSNKISLGVLGAGAQGCWDMQAFLGHEDVRVTSICDINKKNIKIAQDKITEAYGSADVQVFSDFRELNADPSVDAILMALPVHWHSIPAQDAILNNKHIYHEKPMAMSVAEGQRVRAAVRQKGVVFQFGTQQRSSVYFRWASELALNGRLGRMKRIEVCVPGGHRESPVFEPQSVPGYLDWDRWIGPAPEMFFHEKIITREWHEYINNFSLGFISCWGIHHLDIAQWGNGTDHTGPSSVEGSGEYPVRGTCDALYKWKVHFEFAHAAPVTFVSPGHDIAHGVRFIGESGWVHCARGSIKAHDDKLLKDARNKCGAMPVKLTKSESHTRNFIDAIKNGTPTLSDVETSMHSDILCQIALIAVQEGRKLHWDPQTERFVNDDAANQRLKQRPFRADWELV